jgi:dihydrofolate reductase
MGKLRVESFTISLDGYGAGPGQDLANPLGIGGFGLHAWAMTTPTFQKRVFGKDGGVAGVDEDFAQRGFRNIGAEIMGRNMFGPVRGPWPNEDWRGWWGDEPPFHVPVYVLTHHARPPLEMQGGTTFHFVATGIHEALRLAKASAGDKDVRLGGGVQTIREYLTAGLIDELHVAVSPVLLGSGEALLAGIDLPKLGYKVTQHAPSPHAAHIVITRGS